MATEISPSILDLMWRKMRGHISMLQPHMIAVKLGRMGALSLPAGMGLWERPATVQPVRLSQGRRSAGHLEILYCTQTVRPC